MIKAIIFDCFGVLTTDHWKEFVATLSPEQVEEARSLNRSYDAGYLSEYDFLQGIARLTGHPADHIKDLLDNETVKNGTLLELIAELKNHYKIGMLSNVATSWVTDEFLTGAEQQLFDTMVFSYEVRAAKPDHRMYETVVSRLGVEPSECVFIDDSEPYCAAAHELGMQAICYQNFRQLKAELDTVLLAE